MRFVYHVDDEPAHVLIDGHLISVPPNELFEVPDIRGTDCNNNGPFEYLVPEKYVMTKIIEHGWYHGVVEVPMIKTKGGVSSDIESAKKAALIALETAQDTMLQKYISDQQERITMHNKAAIAPSESLTKILSKRGIDLKKQFGIDPPGWNLGKVRDRDAEMDALRKQVEELTSLLTKPEETGKKK